MCRMVLYLGPPLLLDEVISRPSNSIIHQSFDARLRSKPLNGDGFGVAWYVPRLTPKPAVFKAVTPAWNNRNLANISRVTESPALLAHVRAASSPRLAVTRTNCHPFVSDRFSFAHNGRLGGFFEIKRRIAETLSDEAFDEIEGSTDSEYLFGMLGDNLRAADSADPAEAMASALESTISQAVALRGEESAEETTVLNMIITDGRCAAASRFTTGAPSTAESLYTHSGKRYAFRNGQPCHLAEGQGNCSVLVASEPLSDDEGWTPVPPNHIVTVRENRFVELRPCGP